MTNFAEALDQYGTRAYLVTVAPDGPHITHVDVSLDGSTLRFRLGGRAVANSESNRNVSLFWPPPVAGGYDIVVNGELTMGGPASDQASVSISKSVLYRPGPPASSVTECPSDCVPLPLG